MLLVQIVPIPLIPYPNPLSHLQAVLSPEFRKETEMEIQEKIGMMGGGEKQHSKHHSHNDIGRSHTYQVKTRTTNLIFEPLRDFFFFYTLDRTTSLTSFSHASFTIVTPPYRYSGTVNTRETPRNLVKYCRPKRPNDPLTWSLVQVNTFFTLVYLNHPVM